MYRYLISCLFLFGIPAQSSAAVEVAVSIKPLQLIVQTIIGDRGKVPLLMPAESSPHHFTLSPSDRLTIESADLIVYVGEELETELDGVMVRLQARKNILRLLDVPGLLRLNLEGESVQAGADQTPRLDPHIWLNTQNALIIAQEIRDQLLLLDPDGKTVFDNNYDQFVNRITNLKDQWQMRLQESRQDSPQSSYIVFHNAFAYFELEFGLGHALAMVEDSEIQPSARQILKVRQAVAEIKPSCVLMDANASDALVNTMLSNQPARRFRLDLLGTRLDESGQYEQLMQNLVDDFSSCL